MVAGNRVHFTPLEPKITPKQWEDLTARAARVAQARINADHWSGPRLPACAAASLLLTGVGAFLVRMGFQEDLRFVSLGYKVMAASTVILGLGVNRYLAAVTGPQKASDRLKKGVEGRLGTSAKVPQHPLDRQKVRQLYEQCIHESPWILRYMDPPGALVDLVEESCGDVVGSRKAKRHSRRISRVSAGLTGVCAVVTVCQVVFKWGVAQALSYGIGSISGGMAMTAFFHCRYRSLREVVRRRQKLANEAAKRVPQVLNICPEAVTKVALLPDLSRLPDFPELRKVTIPHLPDDLELMPLHMRTLTLLSARESLTPLSPRLCTFAAPGYHLQEAEDLRHLVHLTEVSLGEVSGPALDALATIPLLSRLRINQLDSLHHSVFRHLKRLETDTLPPPSPQLAGFEKLVLAHPTEACLQRVCRVGTIRTLTLNEDPDIKIRDIRNLFVEGNVTRLKVKNWRNGGCIRLGDWIRLWKKHHIWVEGDKLKQNELVRAAAPLRPTTLIIERVF